MESRDISVVVDEKSDADTKSPLKGIRQKVYYAALIPLNILVTIFKMPFEILWWIGYTLHTGMFRVMAGRPFLDRPNPDREDNLGHGHGGTLSAK